MASTGIAHRTTDGEREGTPRGRREISFGRHDVLRTVFGEHDTNLVAVENRTGVAISARGNLVVIDGDPRSAELAERILREMGRRGGMGHEIDAGVIDAILRECDCVPGTRPHDGGRPVPPRTGPSIRTRTRTIFPRSEAQARYMECLESSEIVLALGPAGTGKTYLAVAQAVQMLVQNRVRRLVLSRPAVEAGERLGFLPGDMKEKVDPYLRPIYDALNDCLPPEQVERRIASGEIEIAPLAFMRGRTLSDAFVILDEAQNATPAQMKMFLTRFGENSRMVVCGDPKQSDLPGGPGASGLADAATRLDRVEGISLCGFDAEDVVRHRIVGRIVHAYEGTAE